MAVSSQTRSRKMNTTEQRVDTLTTTQAEEKTFTEEFQVTGEMLLTRVKELFHEGNIRRIVLKNEERHVLMEFPLTIGVVGAALLPVWAAIGAVAALAANLTIMVERRM
jgi:hypothetical protein